MEVGKEKQTNHIEPSGFALRSATATFTTACVTAATKQGTTATKKRSENINKRANAQMFSVKSTGIYQKAQKVKLLLVLGP